MNKLPFALFIFGFFCLGCTQVQYVCSDGRIVIDKAECEGGVSGGGGQQSLIPGISQSGCAYNNPPCSSEYDCINNVCVKKSGCQYTNPSCSNDYDCINNECIKKTGCQYDNPSCADDYRCENNACVEKIICGKFGCQQGESSSNCCIDCGCPTGESCEDNVCKAQKPILAISNFQTTEYSVTIYLSKPSMDLGKLTITNSGNDDAKNVIVTLISDKDYFEDKTIDFGTISSGCSVEKGYSLTFTQNGLDLSNENNDISVNAEITYENSANQEFYALNNFEIVVHGRNNVIGPYKGWAANYPPWITPDQNTIREFAAKSTSGIATYQSDEMKHLAARWLFQSMRAYGVQYGNERSQVGDYVQFPLETLKRKTGDCEDQAIFYASLLEAVGIKSAVVVTTDPEWTHAFSGYFVSDGFVAIETTASNFDDAIAIGYSEYQNYFDTEYLEVVIPEDQWGDLPQVIHEEEPDIPMMDIKKQIITGCQEQFDLTHGVYYYGKVRFQNNGNAPGAGCALMSTYTSSGYLRDADYKCWTILAGETVDKELVNDFELGTETTCYIK